MRLHEGSRNLFGEALLGCICCGSLRRAALYGDERLELPPCSCSWRSVRSRCAIRSLGALSSASFTFSAQLPHTNGAALRRPTVYSNTFWFVTTLVRNTMAAKAHGVEQQKHRISERLAIGSLQGRK